jgi:hypothetical protein
MEMGGPTLELSASQTIRATTTEGRQTWTIVGKTDTPQGTVIDSLIVDRSSLEPLTRHQDGPFSARITYTDSSIAGE